MILKTERLILRPLELTDAPAIYALADHPKIAATTLNIPHPYPEGAAEAFVQVTHEDAEKGVGFTWAMVRRADRQFMGAISLRPNRRFERAEMGYWIGVPYWNQGYTSEAARRLIDYGFAELKLNRIFASYLTTNPASRRVMEKAGMTYEATLRQHVKRFDQFYDLGFCGILRREWETARSPNETT